MDSPPGKDSKEKRQLPTVLPCYPCPHDSVCCSWGTSLEADEEKELRRIYGDAALVWDAEENEWRTSVVLTAGGDRCFFLKNNSCSLHDKDHYPRICRGFPWKNGHTGGPYEYDLTICPELADFGDDE
jgi:hypothetical protein